MANAYTPIDAIVALPCDTPITVYLSSGATISGEIDESCEPYRILVLATERRTRMAVIDVREVVAYTLPCQPS